MTIFAGLNNKNKSEMPNPEDALPGRDTELSISNKHYVLNASLKAPYPKACDYFYVGMGCFWGAERKFWQEKGVYSTAVGYGAGYTSNPTYEEVCSGRTGHNELVLVVFNAEVTSMDAMLKVFWESHDPTQGMRQGNDRGTQYRSGLYYTSEQQKSLFERSKECYQSDLTHAGYGEITTEILPYKNFFFAEEYHQQYLAKNPNGYCGLGGTKVCYLPG